MRWLASLLVLVASVAMAQENSEWVWPPEVTKDVTGLTPEPPPPCPCFSQADIDAALSVCSSTVTQTCVDTADPYYLFYGCDPGGSVPPGVLGVYLVRDQQDQCSRSDVYGKVPRNGRYVAISQAEVDACIALVDTNCIDPVVDNLIHSYDFEEASGDRVDGTGSLDLTPTGTVTRDLVGFDGAAVEHSGWKLPVHGIGEHHTQQRRLDVRRDVLPEQRGGQWELHLYARVRWAS